MIGSSVALQIFFYLQDFNPILVVSYIKKNTYKLQQKKSVSV